MNIFHRVALRGLAQNRTRTAVTVMGVALAAALFTGVITFAVSLQDYMVRGAEGKYGTWHLEVFQAEGSFAQRQAEDDRVARAVSFEDLGYAALEGGKNADKPYLFIAGFHQDTFEELSVNLIAGRMPERSTEVLIPAHVENNGGVRFSVGDTVTLSVGERQGDGRSLGQQDPFRGEGEVLTRETVRTYTVVGICKRPAFELRSAPGYTLITMAEPDLRGESQTVFLSLNDPVRTRSFARDALEGYAYVQNDSVLRFLGASDDKLFNTLLASVGGVLLILIMTGSVFMIYNSFHISLGERTHQLGILMSVGATKRQLCSSVLFEGVCIGILGIPPGIVLGIWGIKLVLLLTAANFSNVMYGSAALTLRLSVPAMAAAAGLSLITVLISAYIPAKKAASLSVMECVRQTNEIRVDKRSVKLSPLARRFLRLEEILALKNFRRNRGRYRSVVLSLTFSLVLFVASGSFKTCLVAISNQARVVTDFDINLDAPAMSDEELTALCDSLRDMPGVTHASCRATMECTAVVRADDLTAAGRSAVGQEPLGETVELAATVLVLSDDFYEEIAGELGLSEYTGQGESLVAVGKMEATGYAEGPDDLEDLFAGDSVSVTLIRQEEGGHVAGEGKEVRLKTASFIPPDSASVSVTLPSVPYYLQVLVPWSMRESVLSGEEAAPSKGIALRSGTPGQTTAAIEELLPRLGVTGDYKLYNLHRILEESRNMLFIVNLFTVVFVAMISLIAVANVFNTISTNIRLRRRELAMLRSVGMSDRAFGKMMSFECALYGLRTLLFGLPLSLLISWLIYFGLTCKEDDPFPFRIPWAGLGIGTAGVFFIIFITMLYAAGRLRRENIIDGLRDEA